MREVNVTRGVRETRHDPIAESGDTPAATTQVGPWAMVPIWVLNMGLTGGQIAVYVALRSFCDRDGNCFPTARTVAGRAGCSTSAVRNAVQRFRALGILTTSQVFRPGTRELWHLRYHLVDLDPRRWNVEPRDVSLDEGGGVPQPSDTPHSSEVHVSLSQVTQEHTTEHPKEHTKDSSSSLRSSSSSKTTKEDDDARVKKIQNRKDQEHRTAIAAIMRRLDTDTETADATIAYLHQLAEDNRADPIRNIKNYIDGIPDDELAEHHHMATGQIQERHDQARHLTDQIAEAWPEIDTAQLADVQTDIYAAMRAGHGIQAVCDALNMALHRCPPRDIVTACVNAMSRLSTPVAA